MESSSPLRSSQNPLAPARGGNKVKGLYRGAERRDSPTYLQIYTFCSFKAFVMWNNQYFSWLQELCGGRRSPQWRVYLVTILSRSRVRHGAGPRPAASYSELVRRYTIHPILLIKLSIRPRLLYSAFNAGLMTDCHLSFSGGDDYRRCEYSESCTPSVEKWYVRSSCK